MKTPLVSYFFLALTTFSVAATAFSTGPIFDTDGDFIFHGSYYVVPFVRGRGGGVALAKTHDKPCPYDIVVQLPSEVQNGLPIKFTNWRSRVGFAPLNSNLNIQTVVGPNICQQSTYWWVDLFGINRNWFVRTGPNPEGDAKESRNSFFQIGETEHEHVYKIMYCPGDESGNGRPSCGSVGIIIGENGVRRLAINVSNPLLVQFKKANVDRVIESVVPENM